MQSDDLIWQIVNKNYCSFKVKTVNKDFCRNEYSLTGICDRKSCPLANSRYATIIEKEGNCFLYIKTIERAHTPSKLWEAIPLGDNYKKCLEIIDQKLIYWPRKQIFKVKQRLTKIWQYLIRMRKLRRSVRPEVVHINKKIERREETREKKALAAAKLETSIKRELLERLKTNTYGEIYNFAPEAFNKMLDEEDVEEDYEYVADFEEDNNLDEMAGFLSENDDNPESEDFESDSEIIKSDQGNDDMSESLSMDDISQSPIENSNDSVLDAHDISRSSDENISSSSKRDANKRTFKKPSKNLKRKRRGHIEIETEIENLPNTISNNKRCI